MRNIDQNQFQPISNNNKYRTLQRNNIARNEAILNAHTQIMRKHERKT